MRQVAVRDCGRRRNDPRRMGQAWHVHGERQECAERTEGYRQAGPLSWNEWRRHTEASSLHRSEHSTGFTLMTITDHLRAIKARADAATAGVWKYDPATKDMAAGVQTDKETIC